MYVGSAKVHKRSLSYFHVNCNMAPHQNIYSVASLSYAQVCIILKVDRTQLHNVPYIIHNFSKNRYLEHSRSLITKEGRDCIGYVVY